MRTFKFFLGFYAIQFIAATVVLLGLPIGLPLLFGAKANTLGLVVLFFGWVWLITVAKGLPPNAAATARRWIERHP